MLSNRRWWRSHLNSYVKPKRHQFSLWLSEHLSDSLDALNKSSCPNSKTSFTKFYSHCSCFWIRPLLRASTSQLKLSQSSLNWMSRLSPRCHPKSHLNCYSFSKTITVKVTLAKSWLIYSKSGAISQSVGRSSSTLSSPLSCTSLSSTTRTLPMLTTIRVDL